MKTMIIFSDTHGHREGIERLMPLFSENDYVIHLGDGAGDMREVVNAFPEKVFVCQGNCDFVPALSEGELEVEGVKIFFCHGHRYRVKSELSSLAEEARRRGCASLFTATPTAPIFRRKAAYCSSIPALFAVPRARAAAIVILPLKGKKSIPFW